MIYVAFVVAYLALGIVGVWVDRFVYSLVDDSPLANGGKYVNYWMAANPCAVALGAVFILWAIYAQIFNKLNSRRE